MRQGRLLAALALGSSGSLTGSSSLTDAADQSKGGRARVGSVAAGVGLDAPPTLTDADYHRGPWNFNPDCPKRVTFDPAGQQRQPEDEKLSVHFSSLA